MARGQKISATQAFTALGLMSGTSLDGVDVALIETDGEHVSKFGPVHTEPYTEAFRRRLAAVAKAHGQVPDTELRAVERELTERHADVVYKLLKENKIPADKIDVIGFHGQTISHRPQEGFTWQIGDGQLLADLTGCDVVCDFRTADVKAGGQGAPLVPVFHAALAQTLPHPLVVVNIGGISNITYIPDRAINEHLVAFDTGPGNILINLWVEVQGNLPMDAGGALALRGKADTALLDTLSEHAFLAAPPPKSFDRNDFNEFALPLLEGQSLENGAATLAHFTARCIAASAKFMPATPKQWLVTGGGRHNVALMQELERLLPGAAPVESAGWNGDALEAQAFAFLAVRSLKGLPLTYPGTTGCPTPMSGGQHFSVQEDAKNAVRS